jgi:glycosyltransferase involved in cell wall biosynthesis
MKIISWQSLLTDHQYFTWQAMQQRGHEISFILARVNDESREKQGWTISQSDEIPCTILPNKGWWNTGKKIIQDNKDAIHIFGGFWADKRFFPLILYSSFINIKTAVMNESYSEVQTGYLNEGKKLSNWCKTKLRPILYFVAIMASKLVSKKNKICLLAIGSNAQKQFFQAGLKKEQIFPWGYFVPSKSKRLKSKVRPSILQLIFIGNLLSIKGLDLVIQATNEINKEKKGSITLEIFGYGDPTKWISTSSIGISYKGIIPFGHSQEIVKNYDYLILPSRHDGWGVVVNEALLQGVPVILSDRVGAKALVEKSGAGLLFESENVDELKQLLLSLASNPHKQAQYAEKAAQMAEKITPSAAAIYLEEILNYFYFSKGQRPTPNWER